DATEKALTPEPAVEEEEMKEVSDVVEPAVEEDDATEKALTPEPAVEEEEMKEVSDVVDSMVEEENVPEATLTPEPMVEKEETKRGFDAILPTVEEYEPTESVKTPAPKEEEGTEAVSAVMESGVEEGDSAEATETVVTVEDSVESIEEDGVDALSDCQSENFHPVWSEEVTEDQRRVILGILSNMVKVEGGQLELGATKEQLRWAKKKEMPAHMVELSSFWICKFPVTQGEWEAVIDGNDYLYKGSKIPQSKVSLVDCRKFVKRLRELTGIDFALPTEAQWEFAARGGIHSKGFVYAGSDNLKEVGWCSGTTGGRPKTVGLLKPNELGLYDMSGNVVEWCDEKYGEYTPDFVKDPHNHYTKAGFWTIGDYVGRGGDFLSNKNCRVSYRDVTPKTYRGITSGLRLVINPFSDSEAVSTEYNETESSEESVIVPPELESSTVPESEVVCQELNEAESSDGSVTIPDEPESTGSESEAISIESEVDNFHPVWSEEIKEDQRRVILGILRNMVMVEGGQLELGATKEQLKWAKKKENPAHMVELSSYWICKFPVHQGEWEAVID
ncbi:MAG: SUMF1/EgtB/PvdO family nonheme iron enzyme, partial [Allobaculum sp.]|nr:SUMF1/EgtB/PvdO family nonheme iron enzyme [Allobaculum sp.]